MRSQKVVQLRHLVFLGDVFKLLLKLLQRAGEGEEIVTSEREREREREVEDSLESYGIEEVEEVEKLLQVVLQRRARQQQLVLDIVTIQESEKLQRMQS